MALRRCLCRDRTKKFVNRGFLYGPYCPIYGFGALIVLYPLLALGNHPILVFLGGMILTSALEYFTSWLMETLFHEKWWDYSHYKYNLNGRICLLNSTLFGLMALVVVFIIQPYVEKLADSIPDDQMRLFLIVFTVAFGRSDHDARSFDETKKHAPKTPYTNGKDLRPI